MNEEDLAHWGLLRQKQNKKIYLRDLCLAAVKDNNLSSAQQ
jgi:hypothetical protein